MQNQFLGWVIALVVCIPRPLAGEEERALRTGVANHAFDHLGGIADQAEAAAASGATILYASGFGAIGYQGLPKTEELEKAQETFAAYVRHAKDSGIQLVLGYVCATSIVKLEEFDRNWTQESRANFSSSPMHWLQRNRSNEPLLSWYGGDYRPACMNNPDWRTYEKFIVHLQLAAGHDGIFFDNPTVHPEGCYCEYCLKKFAVFLRGEGAKIDSPETNSISALRQTAIARPNDFLQFRCTIARDFLAEMRSYARTINPAALITCNNSLNSPASFYSQCRSYGYNIYEMSKAEDLVVVEDMATQPRRLSDGRIVEYGPVYELLHAIAHRKPLVAVVLAEGDYHTPPNLQRLAMAEAAAHDASYLSWPTWPENVRRSMISSARAEADFLKENAQALHRANRRTDAFLFLPFRRWIEATDCQPLRIAQALSAANVQFKVVCEDDLAETLASPSLLIVESSSVLLPAEEKMVKMFRAKGGQVIWSHGNDWLADLQSAIKKPAVVVHGPLTIRAVVRDQEHRTIVHVLNLDAQRVSSFEDRVTEASDIRVQIRVPFTDVHAVTLVSTDPAATRGAVPFDLTADANRSTVVDLTIPHLILSTILLIE